MTARLFLRGRLQVIILGPTDPDIQEPGTLLLEGDESLVRWVHDLTVTSDGLPCFRDSQQQAALVLRRAQDLQTKRQPQ